MRSMSSWRWMAWVPVPSRASCRSGCRETAAASQCATTGPGPAEWAAAPTAAETAEAAAGARCSCLLAVSWRSWPWPRLEPGRSCCKLTGCWLRLMLPGSAARAGSMPARLRRPGTWSCRPPGWSSDRSSPARGGCCPEGAAAGARDARSVAGKPASTPLLLVVSSAADGSGWLPRLPLGVWEGGACQEVLARGLASGKFSSKLLSSIVSAAAAACCSICTWPAGRTGLPMAVRRRARSASLVRSGLAAGPGSAASASLAAGEPPADTGEVLASLPFSEGRVVRPSSAAPWSSPSSAFSISAGEASAARRRCIPAQPAIRPSSPRRFHH